MQGQLRANPINPLVRFYVEPRRYDLSYKLWKKRVTRETGLAGCGRDALGDENDFEDDSPPLCGDREEYSFFGQT
eukprot:m.154931 g.154931  ORF g.154931 m.154931 type:complete len:75 (+) comp38647_c0_seq12:61-285(+)